MNRRTALLLTMLTGGGLPGALFAQGSGRRAAAGGRAKTTLEPARDRKDAEADAPAADNAGPDAEVPAAFPTEAGQQWRQFDISRYTGLDHSQPNPQNAIVEWVFRRTLTTPWHGEKLAALNASRTLVRAYNDPKVLDQVGEVVERFTNATTDLLSVRVRFVAALDTRWRYAVFSRLKALGSGPQGQQIWSLNVEDAAFVLAQMQVYQGFRLLVDEKVEMMNGQTLTVERSEPRGYTGGMQREGASGVGYQPKAEQLKEGVTLRLSPLLTFDGDALDAAVDLTANTVKSLHRTKVIAPREVGASEMTLDVPEVVSSHLNQTVKGWPLGETLLISAGIQPGILQNKAGFMNLRLPGTVPGGTELLVFLEADTASRPKRAPARVE